MRRSIHGIFFTSVLLLTATSYAGDSDKRAFIQNLNNTRKIASTIPSNGDVNPYGVAIVRQTTGNLKEGNVLVSNFNASSNLQGTGTTIDQISSNGNVQVFAQLDANHLPGPCPGGVGLTTALVSLSSGLVIVGSLPTSDGTSATAQAGCLIVLNSKGQAISTISGNGINGPWDMTALDLGSAAVLFVTNVLNGTMAANGAVVNQGSVIRIVLSTSGDAVPHEVARTVIASQFAERTDSAALVVGPTGVALGANGTLYVADTVNSRIAAISNAVFRMDDALAGTTVVQGGSLNGPLGLAIAPNGDLITVNAGDGNMVDIASDGSMTAKIVDTSGMGGGTLFGLAVDPHGNGIYFVDDGDNTLDLLH